MARWIPTLATIGLVSLMAVPAPGHWGLLISGACVLAIVVSALLWLLDRIATRLALLWAGTDPNRPRRVRAGAGTTRATEPQPASLEPPRPSPVQERARNAALRREAGKLEPFRLR